MVGSIVRAINSGLGNLTWEFARHGLIDKALIIDDKKDDMFPDRFPNHRITPVDIPKRDREWLFDGIDTLLIFETPYDWAITDEARKRGIRVVYMPMHEFVPHSRSADVWLCPSDLEMALPVDGEKIRINVPVALDRIQWKERKRAVSFIHNAGGGGIYGRNGTNELLLALKQANTDFELIIRSQVRNYETDDPRVQMIHTNVENYWDLWRYGDVFIIPDKFAGLSLPMQEAFASGMVVMATDRHPINTWLPNECLIPVKKYGRTQSYDVAILEPKDIAETIDNWYNKDISALSRKGKEWGEKNSWEALLPKYKKILYD